MAQKLMPDTPAPALSLPLVGGGTWTLADQSPEAFTMIVVYRGLHCPVCKTYLGKLAGMADAVRENGLNLVAVSMDPQDRAETVAKDWGLGDMPVAYGMTIEDVRNWGLYLSSSIKEAEPGQFAEPGLFWVQGDGRLYLVDIASAPFARPDLEILLPKAKFALGNSYPARGTAAA